MNKSQTIMIRKVGTGIRGPESELQFHYVLAESPCQRTDTLLLSFNSIWKSGQLFFH